MPNKLRKLVKPDEDHYIVFLMGWGDDVSGNRSKQYNAHLNIYSVNKSLPGQLLQQEYFVGFRSTSNVAGSTEQFSVWRDELKLAHSSSFTSLF